MVEEWVDFGPLMGEWVSDAWRTLVHWSGVDRMGASIW